ncbi:RagB/SusD family nutrient uptake outer membrane protein [Flavobacterium sp. 245]|uniref:RagB/SusD family nutrient uptake outer membrane protein n=1 Tax=Flavobacterium sp. 245 TaxID=2512115 RepID=UPI0010E1982E|nr:RagB/SusD family nutrient uptake outer membrane protein [Flavobacterium sp. 245]TDP00314.1 SusD-like starch-binding protein associating with outer membrane [Flavobacterium sp. 245]
MKTLSLKNNSIHHLLLFQVITMVLLTSCDSFVEVDLPKSQLTTVSVFDNYSTANAALSDIYSKMREQGLLSGSASGVSNLLGNYADELYCLASPGDPTLPFYTNALLPANSTITDSWNLSYNQIYAANAVMEGVESSNKLTVKEKEQLRGEALFIRAIVHFYLSNLYGDIPYIVSTDRNINNEASKIPVKDIYRNIIADLENAVNLLPQDYINAERVRPNQFAAKAFLARVYLYNESWAEASNTASAVLNAINLYAIEDNVSLVFLKDSKETIWQFQSSVAGKNTDEASIFIFSSGPPPFVALTNNLIESFDLKDLRKVNWTKALTDGNDTWYHAYKYKEFENTAASMEYSIIFRLAEQYLIRAEARAHQGDLIGAKEDLNRIRKRAGLLDTDAVSAQQLVDAVLSERRWELFTEFGHRFFDLKRSGQIDNVLDPVKTGWNSTDVLFPLPENELSINPNIRPQNSGY